MEDNVLYVQNFVKVISLGAQYKRVEYLSESEMEALDREDIEDAAEFFDGAEMNNN